MATSEILHPLRESMDTIMSGFSAGIPEVEGIVPDHMDAEYLDPFKHDGVAHLWIANWATKRRSLYMFPYMVDEDNTQWKVDRAGEPVPVRQRLFVQEILLRPINLNAEGTLYSPSYLQFDIVDEGIMLSFKVGAAENVEEKVFFGALETEIYDDYLKLAHDQASIGDVALLAAQF